MTSFGPMALSVLLLTFVTLDKSKRPRASSGKNNDVAQAHRLLVKNVNCIQVDRGSTLQSLPSRYVCCRKRDMLSSTARYIA